ncbi:MAG: ferrienterochelin and colicins outer membrane receptor, partial [bacterium]
EKSTLIDKAVITSLPINRRNFLDLSLTTAGVVRDRLPLQGIQSTSGLNFNGQNARQNNVTIDGADNNDFNSGAVRATYSQEAVQEFQVVSNNSSAEFGRAQGGIVNIVTRTGGNEFNGSLFMFLRNDSLSSRNAFAQDKGDFRQYQFGATLGGPIKKDKAFFFTSFERLSVADTLTVNIAPSILVSLNRLGFPAKSGAIAFSEANTTFLSRTDIKVTANDLLAIRYNYARNYDGRIEPFGGNRAESIGGQQRLRDDTLSISNSYVATGLGLVNETRFLFGRRDLSVNPIDPNGPRLNITTSQGTIVAGRSTQLPAQREQFIYQIVDNVSLQRGRNQLKFGIDYIRIELPKDSNQIPVGSAGQGFFTQLNFNAAGAPFNPARFFNGINLFDPTTRTQEQKQFLGVIAQSLVRSNPGFPLLDLANLPIPTTFIQGFGDPFLSLNDNYFSTYIQDDIRVNKNFLLKLGLRYDLERLQYTPTNNGNFSPRVGVAYQVYKDLTFNASYGIFHGVTPFSPIFRLAQQKINKQVIPLLPFPFSIIPFSLPNRMFPQGNNLPNGIPVIRQFFTEADIQPDFRNGYTQQFNVGFNYLAEKQTSISISYQYIRGVKLFLSRDINPVIRPIPGDALQSRIRGRIDPTRGTVQELESSGDSYYSGLTLQVQRRFKSNFAFLANYTFSKALDNFVDYRVELVAFNDPLNLGNEKGFSVQDVRNRFVFSGIWDINYSKNPLLKGFQVSSIVTLESGRPYNLGAGVDLNMNADIVPGDRPLGIARNAGITPGFSTFDLRVTRKVSFKDKYAIEGFFEAFNLFNRVNILNDFNNNVFPPRPDGTFDIPSQENGRFILPQNRFSMSFAPRQLQIGFRFTF